MKFVRTLASVAALLAAAPAFAADTLIDFEGATSFASVGEFYNGGTDGAGQSGANLGVAFTGAVQALSNDDLGPYFSNAPSGSTVMFAADAPAFMNMAQGFITEASFFYSAPQSALDVATIYSGLDGTGNVLASFSVTANAHGNGCSDSRYCNWQRISLSFDGIGHSISFGGSVGNVAFDNIAITPIPEPGTYALMALGLFAIGLSARRRQRQG